MWDGKVPSARRTLLWQCCLPPLHRTQRWGTPRFGLGGKEPGAEILRWESPALPETPLPQDDYGDGIVVARLKSCPSRDQRVGGTLIHSDRAEHKVPPLRFASVGMTEFVSLCGDGRVFARWKLLWQCCLPPLHRTQRWGTPRFGLVEKNLVQGSFVGSLRLCRRLRCLRMTSTSPPSCSVHPLTTVRNTRSLHCAWLRSG